MCLTFFLTFQVKYTLAPKDGDTPTDVWNQCLGKKWDILPGDDAHSDWVVRQMRFTETQKFCLSVINVQLWGLLGNYRRNPDYRELARNNLNSYDFATSMENNLEDFDVE